MAGFSNAQMLAGFATNPYVSQAQPASEGSDPAISNPFAYGFAPSIPTPRSTAPAATSEAMSLGNQVYNQLPGYGGSVANIGSNIQAETGGQLPDDVKRQLQQAAAERGISTGQGAGSPNDNAAYLRALGLTSLDLTNMGQHNLTSFLPSLPGAAVSQSGRFSVSPDLAQNAAEAGAIYGAAPNPAAAAAAKLAAARSGISAGSGSFGGGGFLPPPSGAGHGGGAGLFNSPNLAVGPTGAGSGGTYYGGVYYPPGTSPTGSLDVVNGLNAKYGNLVGGGPGGEADTQHDPYADPGESNWGNPADYGDYSDPGASNWGDASDYYSGDAYE